MVDDEEADARVADPIETPESPGKWPELNRNGGRLQIRTVADIKSESPASFRRNPHAERLLEVPEALIRTALDLELADGAVIADRVGEADCVFLAGLYHAERGIAERLRAVASGALPWPAIDAEKAIPPGSSGGSA